MFNLFIVLASATVKCIVPNTAMEQYVGSTSKSGTNYMADESEEMVVAQISITSPTLSSSPAMNHIDSCSSSSSQQCSGVRRKSSINNVNHKYGISSGHSFDSQDTLPMNGTKKKIRANGSIIHKSPSLSSQDYYAIWTAHSPSPCGETLDAAILSSTLPSRNVITPAVSHRPLERSWPPRIAQGIKPDSFTFDIVDTDEPLFGPVEAIDCDQVDFIPGEFYAERRYAGDGQAQKGTKICVEDENAPLATPETDGSLSDSNVIRLATAAGARGGSPKTVETIKLKPLLKKRIGPDNYISTILSQKVITTTINYNFPDDSQGSALDTWPISEVSVGHERCALKGEFIPLKPHKPLSRQFSNGNTSRYAQNGNIDEQNKHFALCRKPSLRSPRQRSPPSGSSTRSASPLDQPSSPEGNVFYILCVRRRNSLFMFIAFKVLRLQWL